MSDTNTGGGVSISGLLGVAFIVLKLTGTITWSWVWVLAPFWIPIAILLVILGLGGACLKAQVVGEALSLLLGQRLLGLLVHLCSGPASVVLPPSMLVSAGLSTPAPSMKPTIGLIVHYHEALDTPRAAIVTGISPRGLSLVVFGVFGDTYPRYEVEEGTGHNRWSWPERV